VTVDRRTFLRGAVASGATLGVGACRSGDDASPPTSAPGDRTDTTGSTDPDARNGPANLGGGGGGGGGEYLEFEGRHQTGIAAPTTEDGLLVAFRCTASDRDELAAMFQALTDESRRLMTGEPYEEREPAFPPLHTGHVGNPAPAVNLSVVTSVGASLFDDRFGLADRRPRDLVKMPFLANDRLDPQRSHGDVLLTIASGHEDVNLFALRQLMRVTRSSLTLHWMLEGYNRRTEARKGEAGVRNLMGFVDGTSNLDHEDTAAMDRYVWVADGDREPAWATDGSYHVVRVIRMLVEFWDRTKLSEQEALIGRRKETGAPLDGDAELDVPDYDADPDGALTPLDAHIRLANPRTTKTDDDLLFRRGLNFSRGFDRDGLLDQGLAFASFQRRMSQFLNTQERLAGEPLEEYIRPQGGGFYFALPGVTDSTGWLGQGLFA